MLSLLTRCPYEIPKVDKLKGLKENVIVGRLIPAGTGFYMNEVKQVAKKRDQEVISLNASQLAANQDDSSAETAAIAKPEEGDAAASA